MGRIATWPADVAYEAAWNSAPLQAFPPPLWTSITARALGAWSTTHGRQFEMDRNEAGEWHPVLDNRDGALDPGNSAGPYYPNVAPYKAVRIRLPFGVNQLTADQASAGEASGLVGGLSAGLQARLNVVNDFGYPLSIVASGSAFNGTQAYQAVMPVGATQFGTALLVKSVPVIPRKPYAFQAQVRVPSGDSVSLNAAILWSDASGNSLTQTAGNAQAITTGSATWVQVTATTAMAPAGAYSAQLKVQLASGTLVSATTVQVDGLQWEQSASATPWAAPGTLGPNLLPQPIATGSASIDPTSDSASNWFAALAGTVTQATNLTAAPNGATTAVAWTSPAGTSNVSPFYCGVVSTGAPAPDGPVADCIQVTPLQQYTASAYLMRTASADATVQVQVGMRWFDATGALISATNGTATTVPVGSWARATITATAPAGAVWGRARYFISTPSATTATNTIYSTGWQMEQGAAASTWTDPGQTWFAYWGAFEQYPQSWRLSGTWGELDAIGVDALAGLAQRTIRDPFVEEVLALGPNFFYALNDPAGATSAADLTGNRIAAPVENSPYGVGSLVFGNGITANTPGSGFLGTAGPVATFANNPNRLAPQSAQTYLALHETTTAPGPPSPGATLPASNPPWTRIISFRCPAIPGSPNSPTLWMAATPVYSPDASQFILRINQTGTLTFQEAGANGLGPSFTTAGNVADGNWHQVAFAYTGNLTEFFDVYLDGVRVFHDNNTGAGWLGLTNIVTDVVGAFVTFGDNTYAVGFTGDLAHAIELPFAVSTTQATNLYNSWRSASSGESSDARLRRLLSWVGWVGATQIDAGSTQSMGPASDLTGQSALDGAFAIATTENGNVFQNNRGALRFMSRAALYNSSPVFIFGEAQQNGEWPYEDVLLPTDPIHTWNIIPVQQYSTGQVATAQSKASQAANWQRTLPTRVVNVSSYAEAQAAAAYLLGQYSVNRMRCSSLLLHANAIPGLFRVCAQLEIGTRIRVMKRSPYRSNAIQFDGFVQRGEWSVDPKGEAWLRVEASPADLNSYWTLGALHTSLNAQATSGTNTATINALPDAPYNQLASSLPQGYQLVFEPGTPRQETMTLAATGIPATSPGWQTAVLTFTSNFGFTHPAGAVVCEPLPQGYTDPTTWDANSVIGSASAPLTAATSIGATSVTVGQLADGAVNALGSDWNTGDLLAIGLGTANAEGQLLTPNQATAGESGVFPLAPGTNGTTIGIGSAFGTASVTASASAFQGAQVWQVPIGANASLFRLLRVNLVPAYPGQQHTWSVYVRSATTGANPTVHAQIIFLDATGNGTLATVNGGSVTLTGGPSAGWTRVTVTATAPAGTMFAALGVPLDATAPAVAWNFQGDALQWEQAGAASAFAPTPEILSVGPSVPGYSTVAITLGTPLVRSHAIGEAVTDGIRPVQLLTPPTARLAY